MFCFTQICINHAKLKNLPGRMIHNSSQLLQIYINLIKMTFILKTSKPMTTGSQLSLSILLNSRLVFFRYILFITFILPDSMVIAIYILFY